MLESNQSTPELLAPAGGWSQLKAALRFGADAVYLACDRFGMRARANNFNLEEIPKVLRTIHESNAKGYITLNTLMDSRDLKMLPSYLEALEDARADGLIIGDLGAFSLAQKYAPHVPLHVSTQASVMNAEAAKTWYNLGAKRIVCAREMSLLDIAEMHADLPKGLQLEAFVHGAMCVAYSGRCLLSAAMTGRSGNKGACAQSCRWSYALVEEQRPGEYFEIEEDEGGTYILNAQDLNMIAHLDELADAGIDSLKIEGRNKQAFYVATVVGAYRRVLDGGAVELGEAELQTISHRPYGTGFYFGKPKQTLDRDGYLKECIHVATVEDCESLDNGRFRITALCHNRFAPDDSLGVVSPDKESFTIVPGPLLWHRPADGGKPFVEREPLSLDEVRSLSVLTEVPVANRSKEHYVFESIFPLRPGDYLRSSVSSSKES